MAEFTTSWQLDTLQMLSTNLNTLLTHLSIWPDKVRMYEEIMTDDDNHESNLLTSILLKILVQVLLHVEPDVCEEEVEVTEESLLFIPLVSSVNRLYWLSQFTQKYNELLIKSHKSRYGSWECEC